MKKIIISLFLILFLLTTSLIAQTTEPITGEAFDSLIAAQHIDVQKELEKIFPESEGYIISGPEFNRKDCGPEIICPDYYSFAKAIEYGNRSAYIKNIASYDVLKLFESDSKYWFKTDPFCAFYVTVPVNKSYLENAEDIFDTLSVTGVIYTIQTARLYHWLEQKSLDNINFESAMVEYFNKIDSGFVNIVPPLAKDYDWFDLYCFYINLPDYVIKGYRTIAKEFDLFNAYNLYIDPPNYVIQGYQNYKDFLNAHAEINTELISGVIEFTASGDALLWFKENAPREAYPNKEWRMLQHEYKKFFERGGDMRSMQTLTAEGFDTLTSGEYFFAVNPSGKIRFGREMIREEVEKIEQETGKKVPRANHAFLFPGEYILTAGAFFIDDSQENKLVRVNAQSGHFFYSNLNESIRDDIAVKSDHYLLTLGHFFESLDNLGIPYSNIEISKF